MTASRSTGPASRSTRPASRSTRPTGGPGRRSGRQAAAKSRGRQQAGSPHRSPHRSPRRSPSSGLRRVTAGDRIYLLALVVLVLVLAFMAIGPLQSYMVATERVEGLATSRDRLATAVERLEERRERLQDPEEIEVLARSELGLVMPGEEAYVVSDHDGSPDASRFRPDPARHAEPDDVAWYRRLGRWLVDRLGPG